MFKNIYLISFLFFSILFSQNGEQAYQFMNLPTSARQAALGGNVNSVRDADPNLTLANPATMNTKMEHQIGLSYASYLADIKYGTASYVYPIQEDQSYLSFGARFVDYGSFKQTDIIGTETGTFNAKDLALTVGYAYKIGDFITAGTSVSYINSTIESYTSSAIAADLGVFFHDEDYNNNISFVIKNFGFQLKKFNEIKEELPLQINLGYSFKPEFIPVEFSATLHNLQTFDISDPTDKNNNETGFFKKALDHVSLGAELFPEKSFNIRLGYNFKKGSELATEDVRNFSGLSFGIGLKISSLKIDYSHIRYNTAGNMNMIGLKIDLYEIISPRYEWDR